jgi:radical SAM superfamily enzyme YgiQ (UPF0313 family)
VFLWDLKRSAHPTFHKVTKSKTSEGTTEEAIQRLHSLGVMINGSFVFGLDDDDKNVFGRTVEWGVKNALTTATYHILTPYPGTRLFQNMERENRILHHKWDLYDTRHVVYKTRGLSAAELKKDMIGPIVPFIAGQIFGKRAGNTSN